VTDWPDSVSLWKAQENTEQTEITEETEKAKAFRLFRLFRLFRVLFSTSLTGPSSKKKLALLLPYASAQPLRT